MDNQQTVDNVTPKVISKGAPPSPYIAYNGDFAKVTDQNPNGLVSVLYYVKFMGKWRHIDNQATWDGLFIDKSFRYDFGSISSLSVSTQTEIGSPIYIDNGLLQNPNNGRIYFREGNTLRWIPSMEIFNQYHFNPNVIIQSTATETSQYVQLPDMSHTLL
ncbi:hypothetical protein [Chryseobacterium cheonjiense]|uniref:Uncharacterized protein n=1 Tax=Chryseobacterium cheonjiense TaxID=2728845 RepID=A0A7Y0FHK0_9FLAO|nr:hypothetical protein [Chryseobacterium cheonjiense]NML56307.1 hypothetical protein [Chryseobacterium cheonjiense]